MKTSKAFCGFIFSLVLLFGINFACFAENITFNADSMKGVMTDKKSSTVLEGNTWIKTSKIELKADRIELSGENYENILAFGNVQGSYVESNLKFTCENLSFNQNTGIVLLKDSVTLEDPENNVTAKAKTIEYNQKTDVAILQLNVELTQNNSICTGTLGIYNKGTQKLELTGQPKIVRNKDIFTAQEIVLNLKTEEITLDGKVRGTVEESATKAQENKE